MGGRWDAGLGQRERTPPLEPQTGRVMRVDANAVHAAALDDEGGTEAPIPCVSAVPCLPGDLVLMVHTEHETWIVARSGPSVPVELRYPNGTVQTIQLECKTDRWVGVP